MTRQAGHTTGFVDLQQIGFRHSGPDHHRLKAASLVAVWNNFHGYGAQRLVVVGAVDQPSQVRHYTEALAPAKVTLCRLRASPEPLERAALGDLRVDTDDRSPDELARLIGWPPVSLSS